MGRTLPSFSQLFHFEEESLSGFRGALSATDSRMLDQMFDGAAFHTHAMAYAAHPLPLEMILLAMLLEEHKEVLRLEAILEARRARQNKSPG